MSWQSELDELHRRRALAEAMGGPDSVAFHHGRGKLTIRERIDRLEDPGTFHEVGALTGAPTWDGDGQLAALQPSPVVMGTVRLDGRKVTVAGGDFTIRGGAGDAGERTLTTKWSWIYRHSLDHRLPHVRLLDSAGGSVKTFEKLGRTYVSQTDDMYLSTRLMQRVPVVSAVLGSVGGLPAVDACFSHFSVMVKGISQLFVGGPPVVKAALGLDITKEDLGDERTQIPNGVIDNLADSEEEAFDQIRRFLSYLPASVWDMAPRTEPDDPPDRREQRLLEVIPRNRRRIYDPYEILDAVVDRGSFFEISPHAGRSHITGLARVDGYPVGVMINDPKVLGGGMDLVAGQKAMRLVQLCDTFHLPYAWLVDAPGLAVGPEHETAGAVRYGARVASAFAASSMPMIAFLMRQCYGVGGALHWRPYDMYRRYAWPSAHWGSMHIEGGANAAYRREIDDADDPAAKRAEIEARLQELASPLRTAHAFDIEEIIDPRDTRPLLAEFVEDAQPVLRTQLGPTAGASYLP
ncbi:MAG: acyl-CoA carboxylase subunit beta [Acidimicrobiales bacterium]